MHLRLLIWAVILLCLVIRGAGVAAAQAPERTRVRVQLKVSADEEIRDAVRGALQAELRSTPDFMSVDDSAEYTISVVALSVVNQASKNVGATFSVLVTEAYSPRVRTFAETHLNPELQASLATLMVGAVKPAAHWVETASKGAIPSVCGNIIRSAKTAILRVRDSDSRSPNLR